MKNSDEFKIDDEVLVHQKNNLIYLGTISDIRNDLYLIKFDDGATEWIELKNLQHFNLNGSASLCVVCKKSNTDSIRICYQCHRGFHVKCVQLQKIDQNLLKWCCQHCTLLSTSSSKHTTSIDTRSSNKFTAIAAPKQIKCVKREHKFPYDIDSLTWDTHHRQNSEQIYCYCGKKGKWFLQMLQCIRCQQWFHAKCVKCLNSPVYFGDRFYLFACAHCNHGVEFLRRLHMTIEDVVHLLLFNLTLHFKKRYYHLTNVIFPYARDNWHALQLPPKLKNMISNEVKDEIIKALKTHTDRFKASGEIKKKSLNWALVSRAPPKAPHILLPPGPLLTEKYINDLFYEQARINFMPQNIYNAVEVTCSDAKIKEFMFGKSVTAYINSLEPSECTESSDELESAEDVITSADEELLSELIVYKEHENDTSTVLNTTNNGDAGNDLNRSEADKLKRRGRPRLSLSDKPKDSSHDFNYSSDDTSSRGTLDSIIPPPENFSGMNNPFLIDSNATNGFRPFDSLTNKTSLFKTTSTSTSSTTVVTNENSVTTIIGKNHVQFVRTVKRRLSANDIIIGPNMEVKRRKLNKKRMNNVEIISTTSLADLPQSATYLPLTADSKRVSIAAIRSTFKDLPNVSTKGKLNGYKKHTIDSQLNGFIEPNATNLQCDSSSSNTASTSLISSISSSPIKDTIKDESIADLQTSLNLYFGGVVNRIGNGEKFSIKGKRILTDGRTQYLIDLEGVS